MLSEIQRLCTGQIYILQLVMWSNMSHKIYSVPYTVRQLTQGTSLTKTAVTCVQFTRA